MDVTTQHALCQRNCVSVRVRNCHLIPVISVRKKRGFVVTSATFGGVQHYQGVPFTTLPYMVVSVML